MVIVLELHTKEVVILYYNWSLETDTGMLCIAIVYTELLSDIIHTGYKNSL